MYIGELGKIYKEGEVIISQGEIGNCMYAIQAGKVEVLLERPDNSVSLAVLEAGDIFGEMALFSHGTRSATVRSVTESRVLTVDKKGFLRRVHEDPSLAFRILQKMSDRIRALDEEVARLREQAGARGS